MSIADDFSVLTSDKAYYRFFHISPDIDAVDVYIDDVNIQSKRHDTDNVTWEYLNEFLAQTAGSYTLYVKKAGTDSIIAQTNSTLY